MKMNEIIGELKEYEMNLLNEFSADFYETSDRISADEHDKDIVRFERAIKVIEKIAKKYDLIEE